MAGSGLTIIGQPSNLSAPGLTAQNGGQVPGTPVYGGSVLGDSTSAPATTGATTVVNPNVAQDSASIANTNKTLSTLPQILQAALNSAQNGYTSAEGGLDQSQQQQQGQYDAGTTTNQQNYDANLMAALRSGATGLGGLLSILRGTGAEGWANQAVGDTTNSDIRTGLDTQQQNQTSLDNGLSSFLTDLAGKRQQNQATLQSNQAAAQEANATQMQDLYSKLAGYYADMGDNGNATTFLNKAGNLAPTVAQYATTPVSSSYASTVPVQSAPVTAFSGPTQQTVTASDPNSAANNGIFTIGTARKQLQGA